ncbi:hypothetical protein Pla108_28690 [Botrimarina colliarenosi]|uniref:PEP-CTERM protein-sorting domain-containing protein n=1 Tax=Botrimarina colliarenosi TaxID=2528001 RepID=A0A5C6AAM5_9BACT|nr:PEP-CTERM sorting domain-containing protein [Botrimarina colliarenosi]TWT97092.1 hypothetical protein Pla108_28690 [Botrimarina colliarenosi]
MTRTLTVSVAFSAAMLVNPLVSLADVVYDNGLLPFGNFATGSDAALNDSVAESFMFSEHTLVNEIEFLGLYSNGAIDDRFAVVFYNNASGLPGALLGAPNILSSHRTAGGFDVGSLQGFRYELQLSGSLFEAGQKYWVSVTNDSSMTPEEDHWSWASTSAGPGDGSAIMDRDPTWRARGFDYAFRLHGLTVPEPTASLLLVAGAGFGLAVRR